MSSPLITTAELRERLGRMHVLDVRYRMGGPPGQPEYVGGHVPGAVYVDLDVDLAAPPGRGVRHPLPEPDAFGAAMRRSGVSAERAVVVYDDWSGHAAARAWWLLRHHGHDDVRVLDGGWSAWLADGGPVETDSVRPPTGDFTASSGRSPVVSVDQVPDVSELDDARAPERFRGEVEPVDPVAGHIPGAVNVPTSANLTPDGRFRGPAELRTAYAEAGVPVDGDGSGIAVYCGSGVTAAHDVLALELIGVRASLYPGSWSEWVSDPERPVATNARP